MRLVSLSPIALLLLIACGGGEPAKAPTDTSSATPAPKTADTTPAPVASTPPADPTPAAAPPVEEPPALVFDGLKLTATKGKVKAVEVKADGTVSADGKTIGTFSKNELRDESGSASQFAVKKDGTVESKDGAKKLQFNDKDELVIDGADKIIVGDDGAVKIEKNGKSENASVKASGVNSKNKRAAALLASILISPAAPAPGAKPTPASTPASTPATKTPATTATKPAAPKK